MRKKLYEMTLEELWELFPIFLDKCNDKWDTYYNVIETFLHGLLVDYPNCRINHIGSTAISYIIANDIIDVLVEIPPEASIEDVAHLLEKNGFIIMSTASNRILLSKRYTKYGFADNVYHIHLRFFGDNDELYFRDFLNSHPDVAREYELLKIDLWRNFEHDRDAYTEGKGDFIRLWTKEARKQFPNRY